MRQTHPEYASILAVNPLEFGNLQKKLPPKTTVVQYFPTDKVLYIFVMTPTTLQVRQASVGRQQLAGFGNPDNSLPGSAREAQELGRIFGSQEIFVGSQATEERLVATSGKAEFLHLATHGSLSNRNPNSSYLVMAGDEKLTASEIFSLPLSRTRLVTLSACETALGGPHPGAEIASLAEAFWAAGSPTVVASLWKVEDDSTRLYMVEAYSGLRQGLSVAAAFQAAQRRLMSDPALSHPHFWSGFVVYGDWR